MADVVSSQPKAVAVVGCGVIGAAWVARFRLNGHDVRVSDPNPEVERIVAEVFDNAVAAWQDLGLDTSSPGSVTFSPDIASAVDGVSWVQEAVPERLDLKHTVLGAIDAAAPRDAVIASSTSGFKPTDLAAGVEHADRLIVGHPFNPVYLVPLVEVVGGESTTPAVIEQAMEWYAANGMHPLHVRVEIDAFIADRLLEAVWREALWLVHDGVATTEEIDDAIRYGFGLRWAQMGLFETYRIAGGEGGVAHFVSQFGPALEWPWTKLMDVPELTDELVQRIADQSDAQSGHMTIRELERHRDANVASMLLALEERRWGAGNTVAAMRARQAAQD